MFFVLAVVLPLAYGCPEFTETECDAETQMLCPGYPMPDGCPTAGWCTELVSPWSVDGDGNGCPGYCPTYCDWNAGQLWCPSPSVNGCPSPGWCMQGTVTSRFDDAVTCYPTCPMVCEGEGVVACPGGMDSYTGCPMPDTCAYPYGDCPAICSPPPCDTTMMYCDNGMDENGCWMGGYCAAECATTSYA